MDCFTRIKKSHQTGQLGHVILLCGSHHTPISIQIQRLVAYFLCEDAKSKPCLLCPSCHLLQSSPGHHPDYFKLTPQPNTNLIKVDQARQVVDFLALSPARAKWRVIACEDASQLGRGATNGLLKSIEEPNQHSLFILGCTQVGQLSATLKSRCMAFEVGVLDAQDCQLSTAEIDQFGLPLVRLAIAWQAGQVDTVRDWLVNHAETQLSTLATHLNQLKNKQISGSALVAQWSQEDTLIPHVNAWRFLLQQACHAQLTQQPYGYTLDLSGRSMAWVIDLIGCLTDLIRQYQQTPLHTDWLLDALFTLWQSGAEINSNQLIFDDVGVG